MTTPAVGVRAGTLGAVAALEATEVAVAVRAPEVPEGALFGEGEAWRFAVHPAGAGEVLAGECEGPESLVAALGERKVLCHDAKGLRRVPAALAHDTLVAAYLLDPAGRAYPLDELCADRGLGSDVEDPTARDAVLVGLLARWQREQIAERGLKGLLEDVELPLVGVLRHMEEVGLRLDTGRLAEISTRVKADAEALQTEIWKLAGEEFTIGSPQQLAEVLFVKLELSRKRRGKTGFSTDARVLQAIRHEHPIIEKIERWRELTKLAQTYLDALPELIASDGRLHTTFNQTTAATGRLSSTNPNLQNIPVRTELGREIRACFVAEPGAVLTSADYTQVELRVLAHAADEPVLKAIFERGEDVHAATAMQVFEVGADAIDPGMRSKAKMINYGIVYGLSAWGMADRLQIPQAEAQEFIDRYLARFPAVKAFIDQTIEQATEDGFVTTLFGRRRLIPELRARRRDLRQLGERLAVNTIIQGTAADIIKVAMVRCHEALTSEGLTTTLILQIHDELLFEGPPQESERVRELVAPRDGGGLRAPAAADRRHRDRAQLDGGEVAGMDRGMAVLLAAVFGGIVALQPAVNAELGRFTGSWPAVLLNFVVGTLVLAALVAIMGDLGSVGQARHAPWWSVVGGGLLGAAFVSTAAITVRTLGVGALTAIIVAAQLTVAVIADQFALAGVEQRSITLSRLAGIALLLAGTYLIVRK